MSQEAWAEYVKWLKNMQPDAVMGAAQLEAEKAKYADGPIWEPIPDEHAAQIETAYQRSVRRG